MYFVSADCGGTKTALALTTEKGVELARLTRGPANYLVNGLDESVELLKEGIEKLVEVACISCNEIDCAFIALAGFGDIPAEIPMVNEAFTNKISFPFVLGNDIENAISGSLLGQSGIHLIAGTGSIAASRDLEGNIYRCGGWGHYFGGDEGSGYWIGSQVLQHYCRQADGRENKSLLFDYIREKYEFKYDEDVLDLALNKFEMKRESIASLALDAVHLYDQKDEAAIQIFYDAGKEIGQLSKALYKRSDAYNNPVTISYSGSVFKSLEKLKKGFDDEMSGIPYMLVEPQLGPLAGGIILAMQNKNIEITEEVISNLNKMK